jgi:hypothetical protein
LNPHVLFDKSVFQSTPISAFIAADRYLEIVIPPILVREIGGDLASTNGSRREQDQRAFVAKLAIRAGSRAFLAHHAPILHHDLLGCPVPMDGRTPANMEPVRTQDGATGLRVVETPEEYALNRWRQGDFSELDDLWASRWQRVQKVVRSNFYARTLKKHGIEIEQPKTLAQLNELIEEVMVTPDPAVQASLLYIIFDDLKIPKRSQVWAIKRFQSKKPRRIIRDFAPYAAFCLKANLLLGFGGNLFAQPHPHDLRDLEYLYYLPFCEVFASADRLHRKLAPLLMRADQTFVGLELGEDLKRLSDAWSNLTAEEKIEFARANGNVPPAYEASVVRAIWERYRGTDTQNPEPINPPIDPFFRKLIRQWYGSEEILEAVNVEQASFLIHRDQVPLARAQELYPGFNFEEG